MTRISLNMISSMDNKDAKMRRNRIPHNAKWDIGLSTQNNYLNNTKVILCAISAEEPKVPKTVSGIAVGACMIHV